MILFQGETGLPGFTGVAGIPVSLLHSLSLLPQGLPLLSLLPPCFFLLFLFPLFFPEFSGDVWGLGGGMGWGGGGVSKFSPSLPSLPVFKTKCDSQGYFSS